MEKFEKIRKEYPGLEHQAYLDTSSTGLISRKSYEAMRKQLDRRHFNGVTVYEYWEDWTYADKVRELLAEMINADEKEVFYGKDCSDMINVFVSKVDIPMGWVGTRDRIKDFSNLELTINEGAKRFETGGLNWIGLCGLAESINTYLSLGKRDVEDHILALVDVLYRGIERLENIKLLPSIPFHNRSNIVYLRAAETNDLTEDDFRANGIRVNVSGSNIRVGIHFYDNESDIQSLIDYLKILNAKN